MTDQRSQQTGTAGDGADEAATGISRQLEHRGVAVSGDDGADELARLLDAVEQFEQAVAALGGDSYLNSPGVRRPERSAYVVPRRRHAESAGDYAARIRSAAQELR